MARRKKVTRTVSMYTYHVKGVNTQSDSVESFTYKTNIDCGDNVVAELKKEFSNLTDYENIIPFSAILENTEERKYWMYEDDFIEHATVKYDEKEE